MNTARRKKIAEAESLQAQVREILQDALEGEQEAFDNMPPSLQDGDRGERMQEAISALDDASGSIEEIESALQEARA